tara:strand:+ start:411 stop:764 length:354 start_codon:yes stop_codon:yes gene_type:complete
VVLLANLEVPVVEDHTTKRQELEPLVKEMLVEQDMHPHHLMVVAVVAVLLLQVDLHLRAPVEMVVMEHYLPSVENHYITLVAVVVVKLHLILGALVVLAVVVPAVMVEHKIEVDRVV